MIRSYIVCRSGAHTDFVVRAYSAEEALLAVGQTRANATVAPWEPARDPRHRLCDGVNTHDGVSEPPSGVTWTPPRSVELRPNPHINPWDPEAARVFPEIAQIRVKGNRFLPDQVDYRVVLGLDEFALAQQLYVAGWTSTEDDAWLAKAAFEGAQVLLNEAKARI